MERSEEFGACGGIHTGAGLNLSRRSGCRGAAVEGCARLGSMAWMGRRRQCVPLQCEQIIVEGGTVLTE